MLLIAASSILSAAAIYFLALGAIALLRPQNTSSFLLGFADTRFKHYSELVVRLLVGGSLLLVAQDSALSTPMAAFGWILVFSTAVMAVVPWRFHHRFTQSAVPKALRFLPVIGVVSLAMGVLLLWTICTGNGARSL